MNQIQVRHVKKRIQDTTREAHKKFNDANPRPTDNSTLSLEEIHAAIKSGKAKLRSLKDAYAHKEKRYRYGVLELVDFFEITEYKHRKDAYEKAVKAYETKKEKFETGLEVAETKALDAVIMGSEASELQKALESFESTVKSLLKL